MKILVVSENDNCCGPMAACFLNDFDTNVEAFSAGICPSESLLDNVVEVMKECFADLSRYKPMKYKQHMLADADYVVSIGDLSLEFNVTHCPLPSGSYDTNSIGCLRELRDYIKNEMFVVFRDIRKSGL